MAVPATQVQNSACLRFARLVSLLSPERVLVSCLRDRTDRIEEHHKTKGCATRDNSAIALLLVHV